MSIVLFISTLIINLAGIAFAGIYVWLNVFSKITDLTERNKSVLKITRVTMVSSMVFSLLSCLMSDPATIENAIRRTTVLYSIISVSWLLILLACGGAMIFSLVSKKSFKSGLGESLKKISVIAAIGAAVGVVFAWLFS